MKTFIGLHENVEKDIVNLFSKLYSFHEDHEVKGISMVTDGKYPLARRWAMDSHILPALIIAVFLLAAGGCAPLALDNNDFLSRRNAEIGNRFAPSDHPPPIQTTPLENGKMYYLFQDKETGCRWSYEIDGKTSKVEFWQYEGNPNLCR